MNSVGKQVSLQEYVLGTFSFFFGSITFTPNDTLRERLAQGVIRPEEIHHALGQLGLAIVRECERRTESDTPVIAP